jgi:hypothetical protein
LLAEDVSGLVGAGALKGTEGRSTRPKARRDLLGTSPARAETAPRSVLTHQIASGLRGRIGAAPSNFAASLPAPDSDLAQQLVKDP